MTDAVYEAFERLCIMLEQPDADPDYAYLYVAALYGRQAADAAAAMLNT